MVRESMEELFSTKSGFAFYSEGADTQSIWLQHPGGLTLLGVIESGSEDPVGDLDLLIAEAQEKYRIPVDEIWGMCR
jgi:hypothetical protein